MYSNVARSEKYKYRLLNFIRDVYGLDAISIASAKRGFYGETWRLDDAANKSYFIKVVYNASHKAVYERSFPIVQHLCNHGIDFIGRIVKTKDNRLFTHFAGAAIGVFDWIDGENKETDETKIPEYQMLAKVYAVSGKELNIAVENFSYKNADEFFEHWNASTDEQLLSLLEKNRAKLEHRAARLKHFAELCKGSTDGFVITHGDAGGNFFISGDKHFILDWDGAALAPPERDAWVMCSKDWARNAFHDALHQNGIAYTLRPERLAYYCYRFFFFYLNSFIDAGSSKDIIEEYIDGWINESFKYADGIQ